MQTITLSSNVVVVSGGASRSSNTTAKFLSAITGRFWPRSLGSGRIKMLGITGESDCKPKIVRMGYLFSTLQLSYFSVKSGV